MRERERLSVGRRLLYHMFHSVCRGEIVQPRVVIFMAGLPGAGKSTIVRQRYRPDELPETVVVDLDTEISLHRRFDPDDPDGLYLQKSRRAYHWADQKVENRFRAALVNESIRRIVVEGTGANWQRQQRRMQLAQEAGWFVKVLYVRIPVETAIRRAAARPRRPVTAKRVREYHENVIKSLVAVAPFADEIETFAPAHGILLHLNNTLTNFLTARGSHYFRC